MDFQVQQISNTDAELHIAIIPPSQVFDFIMLTARIVTRNSVCVWSTTQAEGGPCRNFNFYKMFDLRIQLSKMINR
jgi:hypothetical protein